MKQFQMHTDPWPADLPIVDPHIHLWDPSKLHYPWMAKAGGNFMGNCEALLHPYTLPDFLHDTAGLPISKVVHIEAAHDPSAPLIETQWLQALADNPASGGMPQGIIAYADLSAPDVSELLARHAAHPHVRGIRQILNAHANPYYDYVGRHYLNTPEWQRGFTLLARHAFSFDLQIYPAQMRDAARLAADHPATPVIVNHTGMFVDRSSVEGWRTWRLGMRALAACPNVTVKVSGMGMLDHQWTVESIRPYVLETIDAFGTDRVMFASNFPVDSLYGHYAALWQAYSCIVADASLAERRALFSGNAERVYRI